MFIYPLLVGFAAANAATTSRVIDTGKVGTFIAATVSIPNTASGPIWTSLSYRLQSIGGVTLAQGWIRQDTTSASVSDSVSWFGSIPLSDTGPNELAVVVRNDSGSVVQVRVTGWVIKA